MKFVISRSDGYRNSTVHIPGSRKEQVTRIDRRMFSLEQLKEMPHLRNFFEFGTNHREEDGQAVRDLPGDTIYTLEVKSLTHLLRLVSRLNYPIRIQKHTWPEYKEKFKWELVVCDGWTES